MRWFQPAALVALWAIIPPARGAEPPNPVRRTVRSGVRVCVVPAPESPLVGIEIRVRAGSAEGSDGVAHAVEHLVFKTSQRRGAGEIDSLVERLGGEIEARTFRDSTRFSVVLPKSGWRDALSLMAELVLSPRWSEEEWRRERAVIEEERAWAAADPGLAGTQALFSALYTDAPAFAAPPVGTAAGTATLEDATLRAFHARWYKTSRLSVVISGAVEPDEAIAATDAFFSGPSLPEEHRSPTTRAARKLSSPRPSAMGTQMVAIGWRMDGASPEMAASVAVAARWLADAAAGPFASLLEGETSPAVALVVERLPQRDTTLLVARLVARPGKGDLLAQRAGDVIDAGFRAVPGAAIEAARRSALAHWDRESDDAFDTARRIALYEALDRAGDEKTIRGAMERIGEDALRTFLAGLGSVHPVAIMPCGRATP